MRQMAGRLHRLGIKYTWPCARVVNRDERDAGDQWGPTNKEQDWARRHEQMQSQGCNRYYGGRMTWLLPPGPLGKDSPCQCP